MKIFLLEYVSAGGLGASPEPSLLAEGTAMRDAVAEDLRSAPPVAEVVLATTLDDFDAQVRAADATLLIAPEFEGILLDLVSRAEALGARLLSPGSEFVRLASDKFLCGQRLSEAGLPVPPTLCLEQPVSSEQLGLDRASPAGAWFPAIVKPRDGAGSLGLRRIAHAAQLPADARGQILQPLVTGTPASVSAICGPEPGQYKLLTPTRQILSDQFEYLGSDFELTPEQSARATELARRVLAALPATCGYVGIDMVLAVEPRDARDYVLEVNPRFTSSYVYLRRTLRVELLP